MSSEAILGALEKALRKAERKQKLLPHPEDAHHAPCLRKARGAILQSCRDGNHLSLGALHTTPRVGHWVVGQIRENLESEDEEEFDDAKHGKAAREKAKAKSRVKAKEMKEMMSKKRSREAIEISDSDEDQAAKASGSNSKQQNPQDDDGFVWKYINGRGTKVKLRTHAQKRRGDAGSLYRVEILHSDGRVERAWLPEWKAPEEC